MNYDNDLKTAADNLFNSELVRTKTVTAENIQAFQMFLNSTIPVDDYGKNLAQFIQFLFHRDKNSFYGFIEKTDMRHYLLLTSGTAIAGYLGVKHLVKIERTGDRYTVELVTADVPDRPRRNRGGKDRNNRGNNRSYDNNARTHRNYDNVTILNARQTYADKLKSRVNNAPKNEAKANIPTIPEEKYRSMMTEKAVGKQSALDQITVISWSDEQ